MSGLEKGSQNLMRKNLRRLFLLLIVGSGWFAFSSLLFYGDSTSSKSAVGLPVGEINSEQFWSAGYSGDFPDMLRNDGTLVAVSKYGFTDIEKIGLIKLENDQAKIFVKDSLKDKEIEKDESLWREYILCTGKGDLSFLWQISNSTVKDFFEFCHTVLKQNFKTVRRLEFEVEDDNQPTRSYLDIDHIVDTNFFVIAHGRY